MPCTTYKQNSHGQGNNETAARPAPRERPVAQSDVAPRLAHCEATGEEVANSDHATDTRQSQPGRAVPGLTRSRLSLLHPLPCHLRDWQLWWIDTGPPYRASAVPFSKVELALASALNITISLCIPASLASRRHSSIDRFRDSSIC